MPDLYPYLPALIAKDFLAEDKRVLLFGESGSGKSTLANHLAQILAGTGRSCICIGADPGSPAFGVPGAVCSSKWQDDAWQLERLEALCTLDSGRFRLPLVSAVRLLADNYDDEMLLVDAPGVVRSVAGAELLTGLVEAADIDTVLVLCRDARKIYLANELKSLGCRVIHIRASADAHSLTHKKKARQRTELWDAYLRHAVEKNISISGTVLTGTPPPLDAAESWCGRQLGLFSKQQTIAMGEVLKATKDYLLVRTPFTKETPDQVLCRDAGRNRHGLLVTSKPLGPATRYYVPPPDVAHYPVAEKKPGPCPVVRIGGATAFLVNGVFGDPLLHLRLPNRKRSLLFDLGEGGRLPARLAHQVTDVFISHSHIDHISGFLWLLRSRIGDLPACNLFGPPGLAKHIEGLIKGITWDRIGSWGPQFTVRELHNGYLMVYCLQVGRKEVNGLQKQAAAEGLLFEDRDCTVRAVKLQHGNIPVLAYCLEIKTKLNVIKENLSARNLVSGPWLGELKRRFLSNDLRGFITLPDNSVAGVGELAEDLLEITPPQKLVYATDLSDNSINRDKLSWLARGAHTFFCEAAFLEEDKQYAESSGHLTTRGCGEIAQTAKVGNLVPFHFSRRYEQKPLAVYDELKSFCVRVTIPPRDPRAKEM